MKIKMPRHTLPLMVNRMVLNIAYWVNSFNVKPLKS